MADWKQVGACAFYEAWIGKCGKHTTIIHDGSFYCARHAKMVCFQCGRQATNNCEATILSFVCGVRMCDNHRHQHI